MKTQMILILTALCLLLSCSGRDYAKETVELNWDDRTRLIYDNPNYSDDEKIDIIYSWGAVLDFDVETIEEDLAANELLNQEPQTQPDAE